MGLFNYSKFKIRIDPQSKKKQGLKVGDVVRRQYFDGDLLIYSLMVVLETGVDIIHAQNNNDQKAPYFVGALLDGDEPRPGELLDFVRITNLFNSDRSGAMYLTASESDSPFMDVIDGIAIENSLCYPYMGEGVLDTPSPNKYASIGTQYLSTEYFHSKQDAYRVFRITRNSINNTNSDIIGFRQILDTEIKNPQRIIVSYKVRASKNIENVRVSFGYTDGSEIDGEDTINISPDWEYKLSLVTIDYPQQYSRSLLIDLTSKLNNEEWCEISDLNIILLSDVSAYAHSTKARIGKISGIVDPVFGVLDGYGAYFQRLYATKDVNVAGTLTAGDSNGFASTFYVGKIHKNRLINSLYGNFKTDVDIVKNEQSPTGLGHVFLLPVNKTILICQTKEWLDIHKNKKFCFSFWVKSSEAGTISVSQNNRSLQDVSIDVINEWIRYSVPFIIKQNDNSELTLELSTQLATVLFTSPQLEEGDKATLYQATDEKLNDTDDYGAWFNKGGIGGTIQNPLLKLNEDGSISSNNESFVINRDGSGHFAGGAISWNEKEVILKENVILKWENLDEKTQENLKGDSAYSINSSITNYIFQANNSGVISSNQSCVTKIRAYKDNQDVEITIGDIPEVTGMTIVKDNNLKTITYSVSINTESLADSGNIEIPILINGMVFYIPFAWSKAKEGESASSLDWIKDWDSNRTQIGSSLVITPKIFAGVKNEDETITGVAIGHFQLNFKNIEGAVVSQSVNGIYGFKNGYKTFGLDENSGFIGGWDIDMDSIYTGTKVNTSSVFTKKINDVTIGNKGIRGYKWYLDSNGSLQLGDGEQFIKYDSTSGKIIFGNEVSLNWIGATYIDKDGIFTGTLSSNTVNAIQINASQITSGTIDSNIIDVKRLKALLITAGNIEALTLNVNKGTIGGWKIDTNAIYIGEKVNTFDQFTNEFGHITIGNYGIRGHRWRLESNGSGSIAGNNISWDIYGDITFSEKVTLQWRTPIDSITTALGGTEFPKLTKISATGIYTGYLNADQIVSGYISAHRIKAGSIHGDKITANTITTDHLLANTITADKIALNTITADKIASRTITADKIAVGSITATELNVESVKAEIITASNINALTCNFDKGKIGGFEIYGWKMLARESDNGDGIPHYIEIHNNGYICNARASDNKDFWALNRDGSADFGFGKIHFGADGSGYLANGNIKWDTNGNIEKVTKITASSGSIAGFTISGNSLINSSSNASLLFNNLEGQSFVRINDNISSPLISVRTDVSSRTAIAVSTYGAGATGIYVINNSMGARAIESYGDAYLIARHGETIRIKGLTVNAKYISSSQTINTNDDFIVFNNQSNITVSMPPVSVSGTIVGMSGKILYMKRATGYNVTLTGRFRTANSTNKQTNLSLPEASCMFIYDMAGYWNYFYCG